MPEANRAASEDAWPPPRVRGLRVHLGLSQAAMAGRVGTRQQTISEWETGTRTPNRMSRRLLRMVAEESGFYRADPPAAPDPQR